MTLEYFAAICLFSYILQKLFLQNHHIQLGNFSNYHPLPLFRHTFLLLLHPPPHLPQLLLQRHLLLPELPL